MTDANSRAKKWSSALVSRSPLARAFERDLHRSYLELKSELKWRRAGCPAPPPSRVKRALLLKQARRYGLRIFVETGTYRGDTIAAMNRHFDQLHSIELSAEFHQAAMSRFAGMPKIKLWQGDSGDVLPRVLETINRPVLFWLDGHYSGEDTARGAQDTPISRELTCIGMHPLKASHVIVVDDARHFDGTNGYPDLDSLRAVVGRLGLSWVGVIHDMILLAGTRDRN